MILKQFVQKTTYQYCKTHKHASVLQSILLQILIRELKGYKVTFFHVYSHLLDEEIGLETTMLPKEWTAKMEKMKTKYRRLD